MQPKPQPIWSSRFTAIRKLPSAACTHWRVPAFFTPARRPLFFFFLVCLFLFLSNLCKCASRKVFFFFSTPLACRGQSIAVCLSKLDHVDKKQQSAEPSQSNPPRLVSSFFIRRQLWVIELARTIRGLGLCVFLFYLIFFFCLWQHIFGPR